MDERPAAIRETHISTVALIGDRAFKFLKPIRTAFLDQSTIERRAEACRRELELNRRIAPDVYLGLGEVREAGELTDTLIVMRRMPDDRRLTAMLGGQEADDVLRDVARSIAAFHVRLQPSDLAVEVASAAGVADLWALSIDQMASDAEPVVDLAVLETVRRLATRYIAGREPLFRQRIEHGFAREGHGDLLAEDIFVLDDGVRILDCLAFDDRLRCGDTLLDVAFLAMDLERITDADTARRFLDWYREFTNEHHPDSLAHHYIAYRALVRSKVRSLRAKQGDARAAEEAIAHLDQCLAHLRAAAPMLVLVGGSPGVGKTTIAEHLGETCGMVVLSSDVLRKELAGLAPDTRRVEPVQHGLYAPSVTAEVYAALLHRADQLLRLGESVVIDASWADESFRADARRVADEADTEIAEIRGVAPAGVALDRVGQRVRAGGGASDATVEIAEHLARTFAAWPEATELATDVPLADLLDAATALYMQLRSAAIGGVLARRDTRVARWWSTDRIVRHGAPRAPPCQAKVVTM